MKRILLLVIAAASRLGAQSSLPAWTLSPRPTLDIGDERNTQTQFNGVSGIVRMPGGEIVVANSLSQELRVFSPAGAYLKTLTANARAGMRALGRLWLAGDTIYAAEVTPEQSSLWTFTLTGHVGRRPVGAANAGGIYPIDRFPDGRLVISAAPRGPSRLGDAGTFVDSTPLGVISLKDVGSPKWIGMLRNETVFLVGRVGARGRVREKSAYPFGRSTSVAVSGDRLWLGDSETGTITQYNSAGRGLTVFSSPTPPRLLDTAAIRRRRASVLSDAMNWTSVESFYPIPTARTAPRFTSFVRGTNGEMWVRLFTEDLSAPASYVIVDRGGAAVGRVTMPRRMIPLEIGASDVLGVLTDDDGLEHVVRYTINRNRP